MPTDSPFERGLASGALQQGDQPNLQPGMGTSLALNAPPTSNNPRPPQRFGPDQGYMTYSSPELEASQGITFDTADEFGNPLDEETARSLGVNRDGVYKVKTHPPVQVPDIGTVMQNALGRASSALSATEQAGVVANLKALRAQNAGINSYKEELYLASIAGEDVATRNAIRGRYATVLALEDTLVLLNDMEAAGVPTNLMRGTLEDVYRNLGTTTNTAFPKLQSRLGAMIIQYRRAATGVQFGEKEKQDYEDLMPGYSNNMDVNRGVIAGLIRDMNIQNAAFWENKVGASNAPIIFPELYPWQPTESDIPVGKVATGHDGIVWHNDPEDGLISLNPIEKQGLADSVLGGLSDAWGSIFQE